jgi:hypothetical protein
MNHLRSAFFGLGLLLAASGAQAQEIAVKADIPFDFVVGNQRLPAGEYTVVNQGPVNQAILIRSDERKTALFSSTQPCSSFNPSAKTKLVFHTLAGRYFLYQIWAQGNTAGRQIPKSSAEVELAKNSDATGEFVLAARLAR